MEARSECAHVARTFLCTFWRQFRMLSRHMLTRISASELRRKFIKSALLVGSKVVTTATTRTRRHRLKTAMLASGKISDFRTTKNIPESDDFFPTLFLNRAIKTNSDLVFFFTLGGHWSLSCICQKKKDFFLKFFT